MSRARSLQASPKADLLKEKIQAKFDLAITLVLDSWTALSIAVQNSWGGPDASEKRDWLAGQISDLMAEVPDADVEYLEEFLTAAINDNFDVHFDDGSQTEVAAQIIGLRKMTLRKDFTKVEEMYTKWQEKQARGGQKRIHAKEVEAKDEDTDWDTEGSEEDDVAMEDAPELVRSPKEKTVPRVDDEGFTEVVGKKRR